MPSQERGNKQALVERPGALRKKKFSKSHLSDFLAEIKLTARLWTADKVLHHARRCEWLLVRVVFISTSFDNDKWHFHLKEKY